MSVDLRNGQKAGSLRYAYFVIASESAGTLRAVEYHKTDRFLVTSGLDRFIYTYKNYKKVAQKV